MGQDLQLPDWAKQGPSAAVRQAFGGINPLDDNLADGIGQSYPIIGYRGKVWSLRYRGERHTIIRPDDGTPAAFLDVIILGQAKNKSKSYFQAYDPNNADQAPLCSSINGETPDPGVRAKQSEVCALCPRNVWKTDPQTGRKSRECTDYKRLAVLVMPYLTQKILGQPLMEPAFLRVPPASLNSLAQMGEHMAHQGYHFSQYVTRITFDPNKAHPEMDFRPIQGIGDQEAPVIANLRQDASVGRIIHGDIALPSNVTQLPPPQPAMQIIPPAQPQQQAQIIQYPSTAAPTTPPLAAGPVQNASQPGLMPAAGSGVLGAAQPAMAQPEILPPINGLGLQSATPASVSGGATPAPTPPTPIAGGDAGAPEASDASLDAQLASLFPKQA